jgi:hypothetical protein
MNAAASLSPEELMKYLCLVYIEEKKLDAMPRDEYQTLVDDSLAYDDELRMNGHFIAANALQPVRTATMVQVRNGKMSATDGPFAETTEQLGGFILIEAKDLNEAIRVASKIPTARVGRVEVRPVQELTSSRVR